MVSRNLGKDFSRTSTNIAPWFGDRIPKRQTSPSDSEVNLAPHESIQLEPHLKQFDAEKPYLCTFPGCHSTFRSKREWEMHEEGHWAPKCYICLFCAPIRQDAAGDPSCIGCSQSFHSYSTADVLGSHILQCELARERSQKFSSYDQLCIHLRSQHNIKNFGLQSAVCSFPIESSWPRSCDFCDTKFALWEGRANHIEAHFLRGDNTKELLLQLFDVRGMAKHEKTRYYPGDGWNETCLAKPSMSNVRLEAIETRTRIEMAFPEDCPAVVTDTAVGKCSCADVLPSTLGEWSRLRCVSRALHLSRTRLLLRATGEWLWFTTEFQEWRSRNEHWILWLCGSSGSGKSVLTSAVIRYLEEEDKREGEVIAFYCCDGRYESSNTVLDIMGVWLAELQARRTGDSVVASLLENVMDLETARGQLSRATLRNVFQAIKHNLNEDETLILVLDGLDDLQMRYDLLRELRTLTSQHDKRHSIKILISSRKEPATESGDARPFRIDIDAQTSTVEDIQDYTNSIVSESLVSYDTGMVIREKTEKSHGRFLCMSLLLFILPLEPASTDARNWLLSIMDDEGIDDPFTIYDYMYRSIPKRHQLFAHYMLRWVMHAARPMYSWELLDVVNAELGTSYLDTDVEKATGGLLTISRTRTVNLVHLSLRDHLMSIGWGSFSEDPQEMITRACLGALNPILILQSLDVPWSDDYAMGLKPVQAQNLGIYAKTYWIHHYLLVESQSTCTSGLLHEALRKIFPATEAKTRNNSKLDSKASKTLLDIETSRIEPVSLSTINMALQVGASFGFYELAKLELDMGATDHIISSFPENPLHLAAKKGHTRLVKLLIDYGADVNSLCDSGDTPLSHAIASGHDEVAHLLLEAGVSPAAMTQTSDAMEELRLEPVISEQPCICGRSKTSFIITKTSFNMSNENAAFIFIKEDRYLLPKPNHKHAHGSNTNHIITIKWLPGASMHRALALAANLGIDHIRRLLSVAGNTFDPFDEMVSLLSQDFADIVII